MKEEDLQNTEKQFEEALGQLKDGSAKACFLVVVRADDHAQTFFAGEDGEEVVAGTVCMTKVHEWLIRHGFIVPQPAVFVLGELIRRIE